MTEQPEALRLADALRNIAADTSLSDRYCEVLSEADDELRRLLAQLEVLEALQGGCTDHDDGTVEAITVWCPEVIDALKTALAEPEQEPVAWMYHDASTPRDAHPWLHSTMLVLAADRRPECRNETPLYTHPPRREWQGLTDTEIGMLYVKWDATPGASMAEFARAVEAALKEKNHE
jgi:hypothetical protein